KAFELAGPVSGDGSTGRASDPDRAGHPVGPVVAVPAYRPYGPGIPGAKAATATCSTRTGVLPLWRKEMRPDRGEEEVGVGGRAGAVVDVLTFVGPLAEHRIPLTVDRGVRVLEREVPHLIVHCGR